MTGIVVAGVVGFTIFMVGIELMSARPMHDNLLLAYKDKPLSIIRLHSGGGQTSCGYYAVRGEAKAWRYLNTDAGLWAEGQSLEWRTPVLYPNASTDLSERWRRCMEHSAGRGGALDWFIEPLTATFLNSTSPTTK